MINAKMFQDHSKKSFRDQNFDIPHGEEGSTTDRPLIVQFCANDPDMLLASAKYVEAHCDAVDINLGCPQDIAKRGRYGAFLQDDWDLIYKLINVLHTKLSVPVTAKFRIFPSIEKTVEYAKMIERAGAQIITCHGRTREQRGQNAGLASYEHIRAVKDAVSVPVFANGNILFHEDIQACLDATGCDGVMSAEGQLYNAALFASASHSHSPEGSIVDPQLLPGFHPRHADLALEYLSIVSTLKTRTSPSAIKGHLFKLMRPALSRETDLRERLGRVRAKEGKDGRLSKEGIQEYVNIAQEMKTRMDAQAAEVEGPWTEQIVTEPTTGLRILPHWLAQPYFRPLKPAPSSVQSVEASQASTKRSRSEITPEPSQHSGTEEPPKRPKLDEPMVDVKIDFVAG
ncbi:hypothetical protein HGRIS_011219 [Hohenbuehelia grisea]|uniref:tRNA-dihydrouridine(16/17) synthase [NAD(P)(+)] n=1 Tax=Hohenbuehelia grisea TaxID=104357 RepID=A0ABR3JUE7_9AGAR